MFAIAIVNDMNTTRTAADLKVACIEASLRAAHRRAAEATRLSTYVAALRDIDNLTAERDAARAGQ